MLSARTSTSVLIIDESREDREVFRRLLRSQPCNDYTIMEADSAEEGLHLQRNRQLDCILLDGNLPDHQGEDFLQQISPDCQAPANAVVMLTRPRSESTALSVIENTAHDYLVKGRVTAEALHRAIQRAIEKVDFLREVHKLRRKLEQLTRFYENSQGVHRAEKVKRPKHRDLAPAAAQTVKYLTKNDDIFFSSSESMAEMMKQVERIAPQDITVMLTGETGTGKTRLARQIHELSPRRTEPFLVINCGAISANLIESEIFGHVRGSFTGAHQDRVGKFAAVGRGTILLDEIDAMPVELQTKLLRVVDERVFEPVGSNCSQPMEGRLIVASNRDLDDEVTAGRFRADLHYRLNVVEFRLPPLRQRRDLIPYLVDHFFQEHVSRSGRNVYAVSESAMKALEAYHWPGNIRQLRNVIERAVVLCHGQEILPEDLPDPLRQSAVAQKPSSDPIVAATVPSPPAGPTMIEVCKEAEINRIRQALERNRNNRVRAAAELGISRMTLYKKLHAYGLFLRDAENAL